MKPVKNKRVVYKRAQESVYTHYKCRYCGGMDDGILHFSETVYGSASLDSLAGDFSDSDTYDSNNLMIHNCYCGSCGEESTRIRDVFEACDAEGNVNPEER